MIVFYDDGFCFKVTFNTVNKQLCMYAYVNGDKDRCVLTHRGNQKVIEALKKGHIENKLWPFEKWLIKHVLKNGGSFNCRYFSWF